MTPTQSETFDVERWTLQGSSERLATQARYFLQSIEPSETMTKLCFCRNRAAVIRHYGARQHAAPQYPSLSDVLDLSNVEANDTARIIQLKVEIGAGVAPFVGMKVSLDVEAVVSDPVDTDESLRAE